MFFSEQDTPDGSQDKSRRRKKTQTPEPVADGENAKENLGFENDIAVEGDDVSFDPLIFSLQTTVVLNILILYHPSFTICLNCIIYVSHPLSHRFCSSLHPPSFMAPLSLPYSCPTNTQIILSSFSSLSLSTLFPPLQQILASRKIF